MAATDTIELALTRFTGTANFTGATIIGLVPSVASISDGTGTFGFLGAAGQLTTTGVTLYTVDSTGNVELNSSTGSIFLGNDADTGAIGIGTGASARSIQLGNTSSTTTVSIQVGTGALNIGTGATAHTTTLGSTNTTSSLVLQAGTGALTVTAGGVFDVNAVGAVTIDSSGAGISIGNDANNFNIGIGTGGTRTVSIGSATATVNMNTTGGASTVTVKGSTAAALTVTDGTTAYLVVNSTNKLVSTAASIRLAAGTAAAPSVLGTAEVANAALAVGDLLYYVPTSGKVGLADANGGGVVGNVIGSCVLATAADGDATVCADTGRIPVTMDAAPAAGDIGKIVYLSTTAGRGTLTVPTGPAAIWKLGLLASGNGADTTVLVRAQIQFLYNAP
jgi:hypothetical protein